MRISPSKARSRVYEVALILVVVAALMTVRASRVRPDDAAKSTGSLGYSELVGDSESLGLYLALEPIVLELECPELEGKNLAIEKVALGMTLDEVEMLRGSFHYLNNRYIFGSEPSCWTRWDRTVLELDSVRTVVLVEGYHLFVDGKEMDTDIGWPFEKQLTIQLGDYDGPVELRYPELNLTIECQERRISLYRLESPSRS